MALTYSLGPWRWVHGQGLAGWYPPSGTVGCLDLAKASDLTTPGSDRGMGFFATVDVLDDAYALLGQGDLRELASDGKIIDTFEAILGYRPQGATLLALVWDCLTTGSDPEGVVACKPLVPTNVGELELYLGGHSIVRSEPFAWGVHAHTEKLQALLRQDFQVIFADTQAEKLPTDQHRRVLDYWCEKYHLDKVDGWKALVPLDLQEDVPGPLPHRTTVSETFNTGDTTTLGPLQPWTELTGSWFVVSNRAAKGAADSVSEFARCDTPVSSADHETQVLIAGGDVYSIHGPCCRVSSGAGSPACYRFASYDNTLYLSKFSAGSSIGTHLANTARTFATGETWKVQANGSALKCYVNGAEVTALAVTDTSIPGNLYGGLSQYQSLASGTLDDFQVADLAVGKSLLSRRRSPSMRTLLVR